MNDVKLGGRRVEPTTRRVLAGGSATRLRPICWDVLMHLVDHHGRIVSIDALLESIWAGRTGDPAYVRKAIHEIRAALEDEGGQIIKTLPKVGYIIESEMVERGRPTEETSHPPTPSSGETLVYDRLSSDTYDKISRRLRRRRRDTSS